MISHKHRCVYIHIPKTAGKSIKALFGIPEFGCDYNGSELDWIEDPYDHHSVTKYEEREWFRDYLKFTVVRNPWDRLVSAFFYLENGGSNQFDQAYRNQKLARFGGNFDAFVHGLPHFVGDKFFRPAICWLRASTGRKLLVDRVLRYENLANDFDAVGKPLGMTSRELKQLNPTEHLYYRDYYSIRSRDAVRDAYAADIDQFGYEF